LDKKVVITLYRSIYIDMKLIITDSKRDGAVIKWLDRKYGNLIPIKGVGYTDYFDDKDNNIFSFSYGDITIVSPDLQYDLFDMFNLSRYDLNTIIKPWVKQTYDIDFDLIRYTTWHCQHCGKYHPTKHHIDE